METQSLYHRPPTENEIDLIAEVRAILISSGLGKNIVAAYDSDRHILDAMGRNVEVQRHMLNRFWNLQMLSCNESSINERYCLIPNGEIKDWLRMFKEGIIPFCIRNDLPKVIGV